MKGGGSDSGGECVLESEGNGWGVMEGGRREGEWLRGEGGRGSDGGQKEGGGVMEGRRREGE